MDYFTLGRTGLRVSRLALGTMTFGEDWGWGTSAQGAREIFDTYTEAGGNGRKHIMRAVEGSLKRLGTDYIDLYILHTWDQLTEPEEVMRTLDDLVTSGKVRHIGLSDVPAWYAMRAQTIAEYRGYEPVSSVQLEYSLVERNIEGGYTDLATRYGMGITVWSPLASGLLSGKYKPSTGAERPSGDGRRC